ncbi:MULTISPECIES: hypothetical protein [unclassified Myroides]|uniref:hypothetical protein n=1 Tax=unclassified Myroides TaxID=2642485 RepID=UPI003D2F63A0
MAQEKSLFVKFEDWFKKIAKRIEVRVNGKDENAAIKYYHKEMLTPELSTDLKWESASIDGSIVAADFVAMDSELPLKKQDSIALASGDIPKAGMKLKLTEKQLTQIRTMRNAGHSEEEIAKKIFQQVPKVTYGVYERNEMVLLQSLSTGYALVEDTENVGIGIRLKFGIKTKNQSKAPEPWSDPKAKIVNHIKAIIKSASAQNIRLNVVMMDDITAQYVVENEQIKNNFAFSGGIATVGSNVPDLDEEQLVTFFKKKFKLTLKIVDRTIITEKNGIRTEHNPWAQGMVTFLPSNKAGRLVYGILAEEDGKSKAIMYEKVEYILLKKWHENEPYAEFTSSQALCLPVLDNASKIFILDTNKPNADDTQTEGDENFDYNGDVYKVSVVKAALKSVDGRINVDKMTDEQLLAKINTLNQEQLAKFEEALGEPITEGEGD